MKAYLSSFLLPNIERVFATLAKEENILHVENLFIKQKSHCVIADFGCGPLSATVGVLALLEELFFKKPKLAKPQKIKIYAIDRSKKITHQGTDFIKKSALKNDQIFIEHLSSPEKIQQELDIIVCSNIFNEIPEKHRLKTLQTLYTKLAPGGLLLVIEPGQENHAKALGTLRDHFLAQTPDCEIISPCPHKKNCPLSSTSKRKDWCWFRHAWNPPKTLSFIDKFSKIDHYELNFSYLFLQKKNAAFLENFFSRCVSDELTVKVEKKQAQYFLNHMLSGEKEEFIEMMEQKDRLRKILLCTATGELQSAFLIADPTQKEYRRGRKIKTENELYMRIKEQF
jgi:ribosomal protein RSM22 (predicted rRNA methylase)